MKRKDFLKGLSLLGLGAIAPVSAAEVAVRKINPVATCTLIPTETAGPFPLDLTANSTFFRQDIRETKTGVPLHLKLKIIGNSDCNPMPNVRVNIWHCDKDGLYSGYDQTNNAGQAGLTYLRGYQLTDSNGEVEFVTIFPGWYTGRICHIHFQVFVSSMYAAISQLTFDVNTKNTIYASNSSLYTKGTDPMTLSSDNIFSDGYTYQLVTPTVNTTAGGYDAYLEVTVQGGGVATGLAAMEPETGGQFVLKQNFPNPYLEETTIPFTLKNNSLVKLDLFDLSGKKVKEVLNAELLSGEHALKVDLQKLGIQPENYIYQLEVTNTTGTYRQCKMMTKSF